MEKLPWHLVDEMIVRRLPHKSLVRLNSTNRAFRSLISDPDFKFEYFSKVGSGLLVSGSDSHCLWCIPFFSDGPQSSGATVNMPIECQILGSHGGLVLLNMEKLCIVNPITKQFRFLELKRSVALPQIVTRIGFAVEQINQTSQRLKIVCINPLRPFGNPDGWTYKFDIYDGESWRKSKSSVPSSLSILCPSTKPVYLNGSLHWLRIDGSIIAFNPENDQARIIHSRRPRRFTVKPWFGAVNDRLTLVSAAKEKISIHELKDWAMFADWRLVKQIKNSVPKKVDGISWNVVTYDGKDIVLQETKKKENSCTLYGYDIVADKWKVLGTLPMGASGRSHDIFCFTPSWSSVRGMKDWPVRRRQRRLPKFVDSLSVFLKMFDGISC